MFLLTNFQSPAAETIANNDALLTQILLFLPAKSLLKFKCVSKHWLSLISNPHFHRRRFPSTAPCALFMLKSPYLTQIAEFDFIKLDTMNCDSFDPPFKTLDFINDRVKIIQSCNGLLLCSSIDSFLGQLRYYICNPTTRQHTILPPPPNSPLVAKLCFSHVSLIGICGFYIVFDPLKLPYYKVINVHAYVHQIPELECRCEAVFQIKIYSSETHKWRITDSSFSLDDKNGIHDGVVCNGAIHWYTDFGPSFYFDVDQEQVKELAMPDPMLANPEIMKRSWRVSYFGECKGHLYFVEIYDNPDIEFDLLEMGKDYSGWFVKYKVDINEILRAFPEMLRIYGDPPSLYQCDFRIMYIGEEDEDEDEEGGGGSCYLVLRIPTKIVRYNLKDKSYKKICEFNPEKEEYNEAYGYTESLACVSPCILPMN